MENLTQYLKINGKLIWFTSKKGNTYIAIKPICEALGVNYIEQFKDTKSDFILGPVLCKHTMQIPNDQGRAMQCLPEEFIYGWIFSLRPKNATPEFLEYKKKVYKVLFEHFHGTITERKELLKQKAELISERDKLKETLKQNKEYIRLCEIQGNEMRIGKELINLDREMIKDTQLSLEF